MSRLVSLAQFKTQTDHNTHTHTHLDRDTYTHSYIHTHIHTRTHTPIRTHRPPTCALSIAIALAPAPALALLSVPLWHASDTIRLTLSHLRPNTWPSFAKVCNQNFTENVTPATNQRTNQTNQSDCHRRRRVETGLRHRRREYGEWGTEHVEWGSSDSSDVYVCVYVELSVLKHPVFCIT